jgi:hypothetical protein
MDFKRGVFIMKHGSRFFLLLGLAAAVSGCVSILNRGGWVDLMPGPGLEGWTIVDVPSDGPLAAVPQWSMDANTGFLVCSGKGGIDWLRCEKKEFADFVFHVEWRLAKLADEKAKYNSGVFVRNAPGWSVWHQAQVGSDNGGYLFGNTPIQGKMTRFTTRGQLTKNPLRLPGEWNSYEITCQGKTLALSVNGIKTTAWDSCEVARGFIGLEAENFSIEFRNIRAKEL